MKILVMSLLRLGDFIQILPVIEGLKQKHPDAEIDVWVHAPVSKSLGHLIPSINHWWALDRDELQAGLGRADLPLLTSFDVLREQCDEINHRNYDLIINVTQTRFSAWLLGYLRCKTKLGLGFNPRGQAEFHSPWFRYLDQHADPSVKDVFHYTDVFMYACDLGESERVWNLRPTEKGHEELKALGLPRENVIAVQPLTSDEKKNWGLERWAECLIEVSRRNPECHFVILGAPSERAKLEDLFHRLNGVPFTPAIVSLDGALAVLNQSEMLITGDTSIKHLANAASCQVIELALGPSDHRRTGIYKEGALILSGRTECAPCPHSSPCHQASHRCAENLRPDVVARIIECQRKNLDLVKLARDHKDIALRRTHFLGIGFWYALDLHESWPVTISRWIERSTWKFTLAPKRKGPVPAVGSEAYGIYHALRELHPDGNFQPVLAHLDFLEKDQSRTSSGDQEIFARLKAEAQREKTLDLSRLRSVQTRLESETQARSIRSKIIRTLKSHLAESS